MIADAKPNATSLAGLFMAMVDDAAQSARVSGPAGKVAIGGGSAARATERTRGLAEINCLAT
jgi:hypothetical protein